MRWTERRRSRRGAIVGIIALAVLGGLAAVALSGRSLIPGVQPGLVALPSPIVAPSGAALLAGAGDVAGCAYDEDEVTARYLESLAPSAAIFTTGDNVYERGTDAEFAQCYDPTWGRFRDRTYPVPGNHEYETDGAAPYFRYFGDRVGAPGRSWYAWDLNGWRIYGLDSNCLVLGSCDGPDGQAAWLRDDLAARPARCVAAMWHHPRYSSGRHGDTPSIQPLWAALADAGAELVLNGHDHAYERFTARGAAGLADPERGLRQFTVGTGGRELSRFRDTSPLTEARDAATYGVLVLSLWLDRYEWRFVPTEGSFTDGGSGTCH